MFTSGYESVKFATEDENIEFISNMGNNIIPYSIGVGEGDTNFLSEYYEFLKNEKKSKKN